MTPDIIFLSEYSMTNSNKGRDVPMDGEWHSSGDFGMQSGSIAVIPIRATISEKVSRTGNIYQSRNRV